MSESNPNPHAQKILSSVSDQMSACISLLTVLAEMIIATNPFCPSSSSSGQYSSNDQDDMECPDGTPIDSSSQAALNNKKRERNIASSQPNTSTSPFPLLKVSKNEDKNIPLNDNRNCWGTDIELTALNTQEDPSLHTDFVNDTDEYQFDSVDAHYDVESDHKGGVCCGRHNDVNAYYSFGRQGKDLISSSGNSSTCSRSSSSISSSSNNRSSNINCSSSDINIRSNSGGRSSNSISSSSTSNSLSATAVSSTKSITILVNLSTTCSFVFIM